MRITTPSAVTAAVARSRDAFTRAAFAVAQARVRGPGAEPAQFLQRGDTDGERLTRAAVAPLGSADPELAGVMQHAFRTFLIDLAPYSAAARLIAQAVPAVLRHGGPSRYPVRASGRAVPKFVDELGEIPVISGEYAEVLIGPPKKMSHIVAWSSELSKRSDAENIFHVVLREDVAAGLDAAFLADTDATTAAPAGLLYGATAVTASTAGYHAAAADDLAALGAAVATGGSGSVTYIVAPERLARLRVIAPDIAAGIDIVPSAAVSADRVVAVDGRALLVGLDGQPDLSVARHATLHMDMEPAPIVASGDTPTVAAPVRSLWQTHSLAFRLIHEIDFVPRRAGAVAFADACWWG